MNDKSSMLAIVLPLVVSVCAWNDGDNGSIKWESNCDFWGNDLEQKPAKGEQCGGVCIAHHQCNHFTWKDGTCFLKYVLRTRPDLAKKSHSDGTLCGYVTDRIAGL